MLSSRLKFYLLICAVISVTSLVHGNPPQKNTRQGYIDQFSKVAIQEMIDYHIPASITMAQACLESSDGNSSLARDANNHFGIKCKSNWTGPTVRKDDDSRDECFRKYRSALESYRDHSEFLTGGMRYQFLFDYDIKDYKKWAYGLKNAGYATDPSYPERLLKIIGDFELYKLDDYYVSSGGYVENGSKIAGSGALLGRLSKDGKGKSYDPYAARNVQKRNGAKAFFAKAGDTYDQIAAEFSIKPEKIYRYNDMEPGEKPEEGSIVYLQRKRGSAPRGNNVHTMKEGESLWSVAQWYGIRLKALCRKNRMNPGDVVVPGQEISLRYKVAR